ncbi:hypothetical protein Gotur_031335 [Gossypium turneri]
MEDAIKYLTQEREIWNYKPDIVVPTNFNQAIMFPIARIWMQFIGTRTAPVLNVSNVNAFRAVLLYGILQRKQIYMFGPISVQHKGNNEGTESKEESAAQEYWGTYDEYEAIFQYTKGFCYSKSLTRKTHSGDKISHQQHSSGKGKASMKQRRSRPPDDFEED